MIRTSVGQLNAEVAQTIYRQTGNFVDSLIRTGRLSAGDRAAAFAKIAMERLSQNGIQVSREMAAAAKQSLPTVEAILPSSAGAARSAATSAAKVVSRGTGAVAPAAAGASQAAMQVAKNTLRVGGPVAVVCFAAESAYHAVQYRKGAISKDELVEKTVRSAAGNAGGLGGAAAGAALGTAFFPGPGTLIGGVVGGLVGGLSSGFAAGRLMAK